MILAPCFLPEAFPIGQRIRNGPWRIRPRFVLRTWTDGCSWKKNELQAALVICGFGIRGFAYSRFTFCYQNLVFAIFPSIIRGLLFVFGSKVSY